MSIRNLSLQSNLDFQGPPADEGYSSRSPTAEPIQSQKADKSSVTPVVATHMKHTQAKSPLFSKYKQPSKKHSTKDSIILAHNLRFIKPSYHRSPAVRQESPTNSVTVSVNSSITIDTQSTPSWTVYSSAQESALPDDTAMDQEAEVIKDEVDELDQEDLIMVEDLIQADQSSCGTNTQLNNDKLCIPHPHQPSPIVANTNAPSNPVIEHSNTLPRISVPNITATPIFGSPTASSSAASSTPSPTTPVAGPSRIPAQALPHVKSTVPKPHKSGVVRALTGNLTSAGKIAVEWAEAINEYLQSTLPADSREGKKLLLKARWALGQMYEARNNVRRDTLKRSGASRALTKLVASQEVAARGEDAKTLWEKAKELAGLFQKRFVENKG
ncbi:hypothetical protein FOMPIDRAFT_89525 [Fomitopsis schrenkii]|uniref:Uncharacterized protein n=1 Tax=Fomitopsis schrenkii TaxID=2126942 RepID=S8EHU2_FOMSC|nr:hypothetical protein FOMPIDRAFT_89525 [Fomitopsis schrenkii]